MEEENYKSKYAIETYKKFNDSTAVALGINHAIFIQRILFWCTWNKKSQRNFHEGRYWTYNTYEQLQKEFPWLSISGLRKLIKSLKDLGIILINNFNTDVRDRTNWYSVDEKKWDEIVDKELNSNYLEYIHGNVTQGHVEDLSLKGTSLITDKNQSRTTESKAEKPSSTTSSNNSTDKNLPDKPSAKRNKRKVRNIPEPIIEAPVIVKKDVSKFNLKKEEWVRADLLANKFANVFYRKVKFNFKGANRKKLRSQFKMTADKLYAQSNAQNKKSGWKYEKICDYFFKSIENYLENNDGFEISANNIHSTFVMEDIFCRYMVEHTSSFIWNTPKKLKLK